MSIRLHDNDNDNDTEEDDNTSVITTDFEILSNHINFPPINDKPFIIRLINSIRCYNIPIINFIILLILITFLIKLTTKYTNLYMKNSLITIIITNLVLYGISETLAQLILIYRHDQPIISFQIHERIRLDDDDEEEEEEMGVGVTRLTYFQFNRLAGFMFWGFIMGFIQCFWYKFLQIYSEQQQGSKNFKFIEVLQKVMTDQFLFSPISLFCFFIYGTIILEDKTWKDTIKKLQRIYLKTLIINYMIWFPIQFFNFLIIPRNYQVPFSSSISVLWNCYLSIRNSTN